MTIVDYEPEVHDPAHQEPIPDDVRYRPLAIAGFIAFGLVMGAGDLMASVLPDGLAQHAGSLAIAALLIIGYLVAGLIGRPKD